MSEDFPIRGDVVLSSEDICDVDIWSLLVLSPCKSVCLNASKVERADLVGWYDSGPSLTPEIF